MIEGISTRRVESTPALDPTLGSASRQQQDERGDRQPGVGSTGFGGVLTQADKQARGAQSDKSSSAGGDTLTLSPEAQEQVRKLQQRDREVRSHEQAHISAGGPHVTGGASYTYSRGPDGRQYAVGGSVSIDTSAVSGDPDATLEKARMVRSAALAPGAPSAQDQSVAAQAASMEMKAQTEKRSQEAEDQPGSKSNNGEKFGNGEKPATGLAPTASETNDTNGINATDEASNTASAVNTTRANASASAKRNAESSPSSPFALFQSPNGVNTGYMFGTMEGQLRNDRVAALYQAEQNKFVPTTMLAPNGTGIALQV